MKLTQLKRKEKESFESLMRRFNKILQQEGDLTRAREDMFRKRPIAKSKRKASAIRKRVNKLDKIKRLQY